MLCKLFHTSEEREVTGSHMYCILEFMQGLQGVKTKVDKQRSSKLLLILITYSKKIEEKISATLKV